MRKSLPIARCWSLAAVVMHVAVGAVLLMGCRFEVESGNLEDASGGDDGGETSDGSNGAPLTGSITSNATWSGTVRIGIANNVATRIESGVTITVAPGTEIKFVGGAGLDIRGTLKVQGTSAGKVQLHPETGNFFGGLTVMGAPTAGRLDLTYAVMKGGAIMTSAGAITTIIDTKMFGVSGDLLIMSGGTVNMIYSQLGGDPADGPDSTHCNIHTGGNANTINITRSNIHGVPYGLMLYGGQNAILTNNNWFNNSTTDVDTQPGVSADLSGSWFDGVPPVAGSGATLTKNNLAVAKLIDAGVRP